MKILRNKKFLVFLGIITLIIFIVALFYKPTPPLPEITSTSPIQNSTQANYFDTVQIKFNQSIDPELVSIVSNPKEDWIITNVGQDAISLKSKKYLQVDTSYTLNILYENQPVHTLNFKTIHQQSDPRYAQEVMDEIARDYPLSLKTPYETSSYSLVYSLPLTLEITLKNSNLTEDEVVEEVKSWVTKNGGNASTHKYVVVTP